MNSEKENLAKETYDRFIKSSLQDLPLDDIDDFIDQNIMGYGTTVSEKILSISDYRELVIRQREQGKDIKMKFDIIPVTYKIVADGNSVIFIDEINIEMLINGEIHRIGIRLSTVLEYKKEKWLVVHWHGSKPEYEEGETDTWHIDEWKQKSAELEILVAEKTDDLKSKNKELEIEAALERVRTVAMSMSKSEDLLSICEVSFKELQKLDFDNLRNAVIHIPNDEQKYFMDYDFSDFTGGQIGKVEYGLHPIVDEYLKKIRSAEDAFFEVVIEDNMLEGWNEFRRKSGQMYDERLDKAEALYYYLFSIGIGDIGISTFKSISDSQIKILKRFRNVFDLAYRRYLDIEKAEAQAREAQIEASLERVRAKAMAMHSSEDLALTIDLFFRELKTLNIKPIRSGVGIKNGDSRIVDVTVTSATENGEDIKMTGKLTLEGHPILEKIYGNLQLQKEYFPVLLGEEINEYYHAMNPEIEFPNFSKDDVQYGYYFHYQEGGVFAWTEKELMEEEINIFRRFTSVLSLMYRRFLDLKEAEAQVREAKIETSLERVRARSLAMQHSDELAEISFLLDNQVRALGIKTRGCAFNIYGENDSTEWFSSERGTMPVYKTPRENIFLRYYEEGQKGTSMYIESFKGDTCAEHYDYLCTLPIMGGALQKFKEGGGSFPTEQIDHATYFKYGYLLFITLEPVPEAHDIFNRFAKIFEQAYTRFLDLQKAEAQAREAEIEAALERVRAQAMGMHKSEEVGNVSDLLFLELNKLSLELIGCSIVLVDEVSDKMELWRARSDIDLKPFESSLFTQTMRILKKHMPDFFPKFFDALGKRKDYLIDELSGKRRLQFIDAFTEQYNYSNSERSKFTKNVPEQFTTHYIFFKLGYLVLLSENEISDNNVSVGRRFIEVFDFAYTRFLDIQKAEAQAKESKIQLALEKVRLVALSLNKSMEMLEVAKALYEQLIELGFSNIRNGIIDISNGDDDTFTDYDYSHEMSGTITQMSYHDDPTLEGQFKKMATTTNDFFELVLEGKELDDLRAMRIKNGEDEDSRLLNIEMLTYNLYSFGNGAIGISNFGVLSEEEKSILSRFSNVFTFAYKRYTDLANAEAQAREAQIEAALERVRARTMAMQKSNELAQTAAHLFSQLNELEVNPYRCNIAIVDEKIKSCQIWSTTNSGNVIPTVSALPLYEYPVLIDMYNGWKEQKLNHIIKLFGEERLSWSRYVSNHLPFEEYKPHNIDEELLLKETAYLYNYFFKQGFFTIHSKEELTDDQQKIIQRFAHVFEQTYTRFLDLENAEKQNKLIQAENERKSEELEEARQLQLSMLPKNLPQLDNLDIAVYMKTATEVGGDYYDFRVTDDGTLTTVIGDATGHGMKAGTIVTITKSLFNSLASDKDMLGSFKKISQVIKDMKFRQLSMCLMMLKITNNRLAISCAAMPPALIYRKNENKVHEISLNGMPLGSMPNYPYKLNETILNTGDTILLMSDGFPELMNSEGKMFGYENTKNLFEELANETPEEIINHLKNTGSDWVNDADPDDDVTFVVIKVK